MKKFFNKMQNKANALVIRAKTTLDNAKAEGYIDTGVKIIIGVVVGAVILGGLYALFDNVILPTLETRIDGMFDYAG
ncbi:MAG: hypothetical protein IJ428_07075 [Clostridia bacterium]|jgi:hypothetical protein|nr:hypothetical protein [Clostridia bacterium]MBQ8552555.1 hypothetical protein [Clostridia bacterium]